MGAITASRAVGWHRPERTKTCIMCQQPFALSAFASYAYTTNQGKRSTRYESRCKACCNKRRRARYEADPQRSKEQARDWQARNVEQQADYRRQRQAVPEHKANKAKAQRMRKARIRAGSDEQDQAIRAIYAEAMRIEHEVACCPVFALPELGTKMHVDHIRPLKADGLHVASNLQILPAGINLRKGASWGR